MSVAIPNRTVFRSQDVCEIAELQPYVLKSWEAEFPDLGSSKTADGPRIYRRADVEVVLRIKQLLLDEGLTLAGARRRLSDEGVIGVAVDVDDSIGDADEAALLDKRARKGLHEVREGLGYIMDVLDRGATRRSRPARAPKASKPVRSKGRSSKSKSKAKAKRAGRPKKAAGRRKR